MTATIMLICSFPLCVLGWGRFDNFVVELKADDSPLTKADLLSNQIIKHYLKKTNGSKGYEKAR